MFNLGLDLVSLLFEDMEFGISKESVKFVDIIYIDVRFFGG